MPTYEYECTSCSHTFEAFQSMKDPPLEDCPQCGKNVRRLINGGTGIIFKGSGFYVTDKSKGSDSTVKPSKPDSPVDGSKSAQSPAASSTESSGTGKAEASPAPQAAKT